MFGYIKLDGYASNKQKDYFRINYCFLCRALDKHYGFFARLFVSYDVTFFTTLFSENNYLLTVNKISCFKSSEGLNKKLNEEFSKKVAALNLALAAGDLKDKVKDKDSFLAKILYGAYSRVFKKVKKDYPELWQIVEEGHSAMSKVESENGPIEEIENCFAMLVENVARKVFNVTDENKISIIKYIAKMLYFMDAVDDIDKDVKRNSYNGLKKYNSKKEYVYKHYLQLKEHVDLLSKDVPRCEGRSFNDSVVNRILDFGIPEMLVKVCFKGIE